MGEITKVIETAISFIGAKEGSAKYQQLIDAFESNGKYKYDGQGCCETACAFFILALGLKRAKQLIPVINYAEGQSKLWKNGLSKKPVPGCLVYFGSNEVNHVELVVEIQGSQMKTIDGNSNHTVFGRTRLMSDKTIKGYGIPAYAEDKDMMIKTWTDAAIQSTTLRRYSNGRMVLWLQEFLAEKGFYSGYLDGVYGIHTEQAVKDFQSAHSLPVVDGIAGPYFWTKVLK